MRLKFLCPRGWLTAASIAAALLIAASANADETTISQAPLITPSAEDLAFLAYSMAGTEAPVAAWAEADRSVAALDEFKRGDAAKALESKMRARSAQLKDVREIRVNLYSRFGEYNDRYSEFDFDMNDGTYVSFATPLRRYGVAVHLINGGKAQTWSLPSAEAEKVLRLTGGERGVTLSMKLELTGASVTVADNEPLSIDARVLEYDIVSARNNLKLGHVVVN